MHLISFPPVEDNLVSTELSPVKGVNSVLTKVWSFFIMHKVLVIEDSRSMRSLIKMTLEDAGYGVIEAENGKQGLEMYQANQDVTLIISDINMPIMDGFAFIKELNTIPSSDSVSVVLLTTEAGGEIMEAGKKLGVKAWMVKPFTPEQLQAVAQKIIG